jgi:anti-anti-sigma factor
MTMMDATGGFRPTSIRAGDAGGVAEAGEVIEHGAGRVLVVRLRGEFDERSGMDMADLVAQALARRPMVIVLDLAGVDFLGSAALSVLVDARHGADDAGIAMGLVATRRVTLLPLELTGLAWVFPVYPTVRDAVAELGGEGSAALSA